MKNRLKVLRAGRDWTQADLAQALEVSRQTVNAIETGRYDPSLPLAFKLAHIFDEPIANIFDPGDNLCSDSEPTATATPDASVVDEP